MHKYYHILVCNSLTFLSIFQQLLSVTVEDGNARRYFYAVQGNPRQKGELFGLKNMFSLRTGGACFTRDIIRVGIICPVCLNKCLIEKKIVNRLT